jgi:hypothetical protein
MRPVKMGKNGKTPAPTEVGARAAGLGVTPADRVAKKETYWYGELDNAIGGRLVRWGVTEVDGCRWLEFEMPDGRIVTVFIDWPDMGRW